MCVYVYLLFLFELIPYFMQVARHIVDNKTDHWLQLISYVNKIDG